MRLSSYARSLFVEIVIFLIVILFVYAAVTKLLDFTRFRSTLAVSPLIGQFSGLLSLLIPLTELFICALLALVKFRFVGLNLSLILMTGFTSYLIVMKIFGMSLPCSCGGILEGMSWSVHIIFNVIVILLISTGIIFFNDSRVTSPKTNL